MKELKVQLANSYVEVFVSPLVKTFLESEPDRTKDVLLSEFYIDYTRMFKSFDSPGVIYSRFSIQTHIGLKGVVHLLNSLRNLLRIWSIA